MLFGILSGGRSGIRKVVLRSCTEVPSCLFCIPDVEVVEEEIGDLEVYLYVSATAQSLFFTVRAHSHGTLLAEHTL